MSIPLPPVPGPEIASRMMLTPPWHAWFNQLYVYLTQPSTGGGGIVPVTRRINTTAPLTGGGTIASDLTLALAVNGITNAFLAQIPANTIKGNNTAGTANASDLTVAQVKTLLAYIFADIGGTLPNSQLNTMPANTVKGNNTAGVASPVDLTQAQLTAMVNVFTTLLAGAVPASGGGTVNFMRADGAWATPPGTTVGAVPTGTVGLSAVNGVATTFLRSDGAPPLSQAIVPTWSGAHTFSALLTANLGITVAGATLNVAVGTATLAPITMQSGTNLTTAAAGVIEYDGTAFYSSPAASSRGVCLTEYVEVMSGTKTLVSQTGAQAILNGTTNGAVTLPVGTYEFECYFSLTALSATAGSSFGFALGGTATFTQAWWSLADKVALATASAPQMTFDTAANTSIATGTATTTGYATITGIIRVTVTGTVIPQVSQTTAAAAVVGANSFARFRVIGNATAQSVGNWS